MAAAAHGNAGKTVDVAANYMPERMARERVERKQRDIRDQDQRADADAEVFACWRVKPESTDRVVPEYYQKDQRDIEKITMQILQDKWELSLAAIAVRMRLANGAGRRIKKERAIVSFAIVVTGGAKSERRPK